MQTFVTSDLQPYGHRTWWGSSLLASALRGLTWPETRSHPTAPACSSTARGASWNWASPWDHGSAEARLGHGPAGGPDWEEAWPGRAGMWGAGLWPCCSWSGAGVPQIAWGPGPGQVGEPKGRGWQFQMRCFIFLIFYTNKKVYMHKSYFNLYNKKKHSEHLEYSNTIFSVTF